MGSVICVVVSSKTMLGGHSNSNVNKKITLLSSNFMENYPNLRT